MPFQCIQRQKGFYMYAAYSRIRMGHYEGVCWGVVTALTVSEQRHSTYNSNLTLKLSCGIINAGKWSIFNMWTSGSSLSLLSRIRTHLWHDLCRRKYFTPCFDTDLYLSNLLIDWLIDWWSHLQNNKTPSPQEIDRFEIKLDAVCK